MGYKKKDTGEKSLEKMTAKELREIALKLPEISGVHGMNKLEMVAAINKSRGIEQKTKTGMNTSVRDIKKKIKELKIKCEAVLESSDKKIITIYKRKINRLKKKTRRAA